MKHTTNKNIAFFGTPQLSVWVLEELAAAHITPSLIVTAPDEPAGRKLLLTPPPAKVWAEAHDIPFLQPRSLKNRAAAPELANSEWDLFIVVAYNNILPLWLLNLPRFGALNVHPSLLPKLRGPSPIRTALLQNQQDAVGVTIIKLDEKTDHGPIVAQATVDPLEGGEEALGWPVPGHILDEILLREGGRLLAEVMPLWLKGEITPEEQDHSQATFTKKFTKADGEITLDDDPFQNWLKFCAFDGWPGTFFFLQPQEAGAPLRIKITDAEYRDGAFHILRVIPEGKKEMSWEDFERSHQ